MNESSLSVYQRQLDDYDVSGNTMEMRPGVRRGVARGASHFRLHRVLILTIMSEPLKSGREPASTVADALHATLNMPFEDAVLHVQLEHELAGFETVKVTRLDHMVESALGEEIPRVALVIVCHAEVARDAVIIDPTIAGLLPCTIAVYEVPGEDAVHVHHLSVGKAVRDLGVADDAEAVEDLVALTGDLIDEVWKNVEHIGNDDDATP